jgi:hypothetical protein
MQSFVLPRTLFLSGAIVQKQVQRHIAESGRAAFSLPLTGAISFFFGHANTASEGIVPRSQLDNP